MRAKIGALIALAMLLGLWGGYAHADGIPPEPHAFWGYVTINGNPAPVGTVVEAKGDSVIRGVAGNPITVTQAGRYGGTDIGDPMLLVQGNISPNSPISFWVNGVDTGVTYPFGSGGPTKLDLSVTAVARPGDANGDGSIDVLDMTKVARIILLLDERTSGADANQDGRVSVLDMTKIARIILGLE